MVEESVDRGELYKMVPVNKTKESLATSTSVEGFSKRYNKKREPAEMRQEQKIESFEEIENIYDKGFLGNLNEVFFPPKF